jgi:nitronate monooxygenase
MSDSGAAQPSAVRARADAFCRRYSLDMPILEAPMASACPAGLAAAVANAGGMGAIGALPMAPQGIRD